jgi:NAD(P)H dehydrogenase (quinone)
LPNQQADAPLDYEDPAPTPWYYRRMTQMVSRDWELPVLVSGASGRLGRQVIVHLLDRYGVPARQIIATTRSPELIADLAARGVIVRVADFARPESLAGAFAGARRALLISVLPDVDYPGQEGRRQRLQIGAIGAAHQAGVPHVLYTSVPNAEPGNPAFWHAEHYATELALIGSGLRWTILRNWDFPDSKWRNLWRRALESGVFYTAAGDGGVSYVAREDAAAAAAGALLSRTSVCRRFDITGPEVLSVTDVFSILEKLTGRTVSIEQVTTEEWKRRFAAAGGEPEWLANRLLVVPAHMQAEKGGFFGGVSDAVAELTGKPPMRMIEYLPRLMSSNSDYTPRK